MAAQVLLEMGIELKRENFSEGQTIREDTMRTENYKRIVIPSLNKTILVCDPIGNATFVIHTAEDPDRYSAMKKEELMELARVGKVTFLQWPKGSKDKADKETKWKNTLRTILETTPPQTTEEESVTIQMDEKYFATVNVQRDLLIFAAENGEEGHPENLADHKHRTARINGQRMLLRTYCQIAGKALGIVRTTREADKKDKYHEIWDHLLIKGGFELKEKYPPMNKDYFSNKNNLRHDLLAYANALTLLNPAEEQKTPRDLSTKNMRTLEVECNNGEVVNGLTYISRAGVSLRDIKREKAQNITGFVLRELVVRGGF